MISIGSKLFVGFVFTLLGLSFLATTGVYIYEFSMEENAIAEWYPLMSLYSHLFIFFPTFGIFALMAFYTPATAFVDFYWNHLKAGRIRFIVGTIAICALSFLIAQKLNQGEIPTVWQIKPTQLSDSGDPNSCVTNKNCTRLPILESVKRLHEESTSRIGMTKFSRQCSFDPLIPEPAERAELRFCFVNGQMSNAATCCTAQAQFTSHLRKLYKNPENISLTSKVHEILLPLKVFFLIVLLFVGIMLAMWRKQLKLYYGPAMPSIINGILIGAVIMLFWPISNHAFVTTSELLYGNYSNSLFAQMTPIYSFIFALWVLSLLFFLYHYLNPSLAKNFLGIVSVSAAFLQYEPIVNYAIQFFSSIADIQTIAIIIIIALLFLVFIFLPKNSLLKKDEKN